MLRKAVLMKRLGDVDGGMLQLDAGDLLFPTEMVPEPLKRQSEAQARYLLRAMDLTAHDAVVPGEKDFSLGLAVFESLAKGSKTRFLAANLKRVRGGVFLPGSQIFVKKTKQKKDLRIAVIGLVGEKLTWPKGLRASSAIATAKKEVPELRKKSDLVIALTHQGYEADLALARAVPGIDVIVGGHTQSFLQTPMKIGKTLILQSSFRNQYVGVLPLEASPLGGSYQLTGLDAGYETPAEVAAIAQLVTEFKAEIAKMNADESASTVAAQRFGEGTAKFQTFPKCAECHLKQFDFWRKTRHAHAFEPLFAQNQSKNKECLSCHTAGFTAGLNDAKGWTSVNQLIQTTQGQFLSHEEIRSWLSKLHSADSSNEKAKLQDSDAEATPLRGHLGRLAQAWTPVQCENCHSPGQGHPFGGTYKKTVDNKTCLQCHTADRAPAWYTQDGKSPTPNEAMIAAKRALITCPAGELAPEE